MTKSASSQTTPFTRKPVKGLFRTFREISSSLGELTVNGVDGLIFEQRKAQLRERLIDDAAYWRDLQDDAKPFGGIDGCKVAHNQLVWLLEELQL